MNTTETQVGQLGAVILAGGEATRLPGKCFRVLGGKELILHVFERISQVTKDIVVSVRNAQQADRVKQLLQATPIVQDSIQKQSPLVGLVSGLRASRKPYIFAAPCDTIFIEPEVIRLLLRRAIGNDGAIPMAEGNLLEPLCAVYRRESALLAAEKPIQNDRLSMLEMITQLTKLIRVPVEDIRRIDPQLLTLRNINTEQDMAWATEIIQTRNVNKALK
ncbi:MAG TPA: molybdenum cofactor guanylyltransferase [Candidatus Bathyarchaeia archaeon]|nr:molybdenum cofactor guanylyltransferase [Candidatus Bathyarchaeia archaeon]